VSELALLLIEELVLTDRAVVGNTDDYRVSGDVLGAAVNVSAGVIDVPAVPDSYQRIINSVVAAAHRMTSR